MMFWDSSGIVPLCLDEARTKLVAEVVGEDPFVVAWWTTTVECMSTFARLRRENVIDRQKEELLRDHLKQWSSEWVEIEPGPEIKSIAGQLLLLHPLRAADSLQLAAALVWADKLPDGHKFVSFDDRLRDAARKEGFSVLPAEI